MGKRLLTIILLTHLFQITAQAQLDIKNSLGQLSGRLKSEGKNTGRVRLLLALNNFYLYNKMATTANLDTAMNYAVEARDLSKALNDMDGNDDAAVAIARCRLRRYDTTAVLAQLRTSSNNQHLKLLLLTGRFFYFVGGGDKVMLDKAASLFDQAAQLSKNTNARGALQVSRIYSATLYFSRGKPDLATRDLYAIINDCKSGGDPENEALAFVALAENSADADKKVNFYNQAVEIYNHMHRYPEAIALRKLIGDAHLVQGKLDLSEKELTAVLEDYKKLKYQNLQYTYDLLSAVTRIKGDMHKALVYALNAIESMQKSGSDYATSEFDMRLGHVYRELGQTKECIFWYNMAITDFLKEENTFPYGVYMNIADELIKEGKISQVLKRINQIVVKYPPTGFEKVMVANLMGNCYNALKSYTLAEQYYKEMVRLENLQKRKDFNFAVIYQAMGEFNLQRKEFKEAGYYLTQLITLPPGIIPATRLRDVHGLLFKVDSAKGNLISAIRHFQTFKAMNDSIFSAAKSKQIEELQISYKTSQKEQENESLRNKGKLQQNELQRISVSRNITFLVVVALLLIIGLLYYLYRLKQNNNRKLTFQQLEINSQNGLLKKLVKEKEWLIKEIHHRVKNNLQIIMSLLNTQSSYLENNDALVAIKDSQNRLQSISLIHQKLYQSENMASIEIKAYITDLIGQLCNSFEKARQITFEYEIPAVRFDVAEAVPLGLIINEAITNIIKYAYPGSERGKVRICLSEQDNNTYKLLICDNGRGLPEGFDLYNCRSLGMDLMRGLSEQLRGSFYIFSDNGVTLEVTFKGGVLMMNQAV